MLGFAQKCSGNVYLETGIPKIEKLDILCYR